MKMENDFSLWLVSKIQEKQGGTEKFDKSCYPEIQKFKEIIEITLNQNEPQKVSLLCQKANGYHHIFLQWFVSQFQLSWTFMKSIN